MSTSHSSLAPAGRRIAIAAVAAWSLSACDLTGPITVSELRVTSGGGQTATVATSLAEPVVISALGEGKGVSGRAINLTASHGGSVTPATARTDGEGRISVQWSLGTEAGTQTLRAVLESDTTVTVAATAIGSAGELASLQVDGGDSQVGRPDQALAQPVVFVARDAHGNARAGTDVTVSVDRGDGALGTASGTTDAAGRFSTTWTLGSQAVRQRIEAAAGGQTAVATATVDTTRAIVYLNMPEELAPGDTSFIATVRVNLSGVGTERRGLLSARFTWPANGTTTRTINLDGVEIWAYQPESAPDGHVAMSIAVSRPRNDLAHETSYALRFYVPPDRPQGDLVMSFTPLALLGAGTFNDLLASVAVVGGTVRIR